MGDDIKKTCHQSFFAYEKDGILYEFEYFADMQEQLILKMKESGLSMRQCFGF